MSHYQFVPICVSLKFQPHKLDQEDQPEDDVKDKRETLINKKAKKSYID